MKDFQTDNKGRVIISKDALINATIYSDVTYRSNKSKARFEEIKQNGNRFVILESLPEQTRRKVMAKLSGIKNEYTGVLLASSAAGIDCAPLAVEFTADTLHINEPFIRSSIETYITSHYSAYTWAYLDANLNSESVKGYAKQCALLAWVYDFVTRIRTTEPDVKRASQLLRSFRMNLLTAISNITLEVKIPNSETRFNGWFDDVLKQLDGGNKPENIIQIKRKGNPNAEKVTDEQLRIVVYWHKNGTNMSVPTLYKKWLEYGKRAGWWMKNGVFTPPTEGRLYQLLQPLKNPLMLGKTDAITHRLNVVPTATRELPKQVNHVWVIDGTAHNENVAAGGKVRQHVYAIKVMDVASMRMVGVSSLIGVREPFFALKDAILMGIRETGYKPAMIHCDHGPSWKELENWCIENDIKLYPSLTGNARAKTIEHMFAMFDNDITRFLRGYSGQNRTATGSITSKPSERKETQGKANARSASIAIEWVKNEGIVAWNERVIETLERKTCNKTPYELWDSMTSYTPRLSYTQLCMMCGTLHERKLTIEGLDIQHNNKSYLYFPAIETPTQREIAENIFSQIPIDKHNDNALKIYVLRGGESAPVFTRDGKYLGVWGVKKTIAFTAGIDGTTSEKETLNNMMALQYRVTDHAKQLANEIDTYVERHPDFEVIDELGREMLTGKRRTYTGRTYTGRYDKSALLQEEADAKAFKTNEKEQQYRELIDPDSGEIFRVKINN